MGDAAFTALTTQRLVLRRFRPEDLDAFVAYRSDPETARYQSWEAPYRPTQVFPVFPYEDGRVGQRPRG